MKKICDAWQLISTLIKKMRDENYLTDMIIPAIDVHDLEKKLYEHGISDCQFGYYDFYEINEQEPYLMELTDDIIILHKSWIDHHAFINYDYDKELGELILSLLTLSTDIKFNKSYITSKTLWVARDKRNNLWLFYERPHRLSDMWYDYSDKYPSMDLSGVDIFKEIKWEDEPQKAIIKEKNGGGLWVARNPDTTLHLFNTKPQRRGHVWWVDKNEPCGMSVDKLNVFPKLEKDDKPIEVEVVIIK